MLSRGRSFRTSQAAELIGPAQKSFRVFAQITGDNEQVTRLGLERAGKHWRARKNGKELSQISQLTRSLPLVVMEPNSHLLVSGPPEYRRKFIDRGVFHVEHGFLETWIRFSKALKQRNAALRRRQNDLLDSLDATLSAPAMKLSAFRTAHAQVLGQELEALLPQLSSALTNVSLSYHNGWGDCTYAEALLNNREQDVDGGVTRLGPHRADILLMMSSALARTILSRGEQKMLSAALLMTQARQLALLGERPILLLDDLASEFDTTHFKKVLSNALECAGQVWVTGVRAPQWATDHGVFHVEHGLLQEVV